MITILGIETSCDDTSIAIYDTENKSLIQKNICHSKMNIYYGGIVPLVSARLHFQYLLKLIQKYILINNYQMHKIDIIAYTAGPGLIGSLMIGATIACTLAYTYKKPLIPINHLEAHLLSPFINYDIDKIKFPVLGLIISGGNTQLIYISKMFHYTIISKTKDDALGEIFDKIGKKLNLKYPWAKSLENIAKFGNYNKMFKYPTPMTKTKNLDFSFSGLKTAVINSINQQIVPLSFSTKANIAYAFLATILNILLLKCKWSLDFFPKTKMILITGGVSANLNLRKHISILLQQKTSLLEILFPKLIFCTDNAGMIAYLASLKFKFNQYNQFLNYKIKVFPEWDITSM